MHVLYDSVGAVKLHKTPPHLFVSATQNWVHGGGRRMLREVFTKSPYKHLPGRRGMSTAGMTELPPLPDKEA